MNTGEPRALAQRNRTTARRIIGAVLAFHSMALFGGYLVLDRALHPDLPASDRAALGPLPTATRPAPAPARVNTTAATPTEAPAWLTAARSQDTAAPWRVDAQGHVHWDAAELKR